MSKEKGPRKRKASSRKAASDNPLIVLACTLRQHSQALNRMGNAFSKAAAPEEREKIRTAVELTKRDAKACSDLASIITGFVTQGEQPPEFSDLIIAFRAGLKVNIDKLRRVEQEVVRVMSKAKDFQGTPETVSAEKALAGALKSAQDLLSAFAPFAGNN
jgi:hypothetical protein